MGNGISDNYDEITPLFTVGLWSVHKAVSKVRGDNVSLWLFDQEKLKTLIKKKADREAFLRQQLEGLQQMRRLCHPRILKVYELCEDISALSFAAEPIEYSLVYETSFSLDECKYIALQLAEALNFLHTTAKVAHLNVSQQAICLTKHFDLKICDMSFSSPIINELGVVGAKTGALQVPIAQPPMEFSSPEILNNAQVTIKSDVFAYAALVGSCFSNRILFSPASGSDLVAQAQVVGTMLPQNVDKEMKRLLSSCLQADATKRPSFEDVLRDPAFLAIETRILKYMDVIITKDPGDKFKFFKNLPQVMPSFSQRILRFKFAPLFISEVESDIRFGPILIPLVVKIGRNLEKEEFNEEILTPIQKFLIITNPPEVLSACFSVIDILVSKINGEDIYDTLYPMFTAGLQSQSSKLHAEAINRMPLLISSLSQESNQNSLIPRLLEFIQTADENAAPACISCLQHAVQKTDPNWFAQTVLPKITPIVEKVNNAEIADSVMQVLDKLRPSTDNALKYVFPLSAQLLTIQSVAPDVQLKICSIIQKQIEKLKKDRHLESKWASNAKQNIKKSQKTEEDDFQKDPFQKPNDPRKEAIQETSTDIFSALSAATKPRATVLPKKAPVAPKPAPVSEAEPDQEQEFNFEGEDEVEADENDETDAAIAEVVAAPKPAPKKGGSMFSGLNVQTSTVRPKASWKRSPRK